MGPRGLSLALVISGQPSGAAATLPYCEKVRETYELGEAALCDPDDALAAYGKNALVLLLSPSGVIEYKKVVASHEALHKLLLERLPE